MREIETAASAFFQTIFFSLSRSLLVLVHKCSLAVCVLCVWKIEKKINRGKKQHHISRLHHSRQFHHHYACDPWIPFTYSVCATYTTARLIYVCLCVCVCVCLIFCECNTAMKTASVTDFCATNFFDI